MRRGEEESEVAADGFGVAGIEVGDEEEGDAEDDEGDEAVGAEWWSDHCGLCEQCFFECGSWAAAFEASRRPRFLRCETEIKPQKRDHNSPSINLGQGG